MFTHTAVSTSPWRKALKIKTGMTLIFLLAIVTLAYLAIDMDRHSFAKSLNPPSNKPHFRQEDIDRQSSFSIGKHRNGTMPDAWVLDTTPDARVLDTTPDTRVLDTTPDAPVFDTIPDARVFDFIMVNDELDALWIRLSELYDVMDTFYIVETNITFSGRPKPLHFADNRRRFEQFTDKIIHVIVPPIPSEDYRLYDEVWRVGMWLNEMWTRNKGLRIAIDTHQPREGDWIILSDLDELPRASFIKALAHPDPSTELGRQLDQESTEWAGDLLRLGCKYFFYSYEYLLNHGWNGPVAFRYREPDSPVFLKKGSVAKRNTRRLKWLMGNNWARTGNHLRNERDGDGAYMPEQCHHCSWCFRNITQVLRKMDSWSHQEFNLEKYRDRAWILERAKTGTDPFERSSETYKYIPDNQDMPTYILQNQDTYSFMCKRYGQPNAGFLDVNPEDPLGPLL